MRDKLIELLSENFVDFCHVVMVAGNCKISAVTLDADKFADRLIANGVTFAESLVGINKTSPVTNGDKVRRMTDEELAEFNHFCPFIDEECTMKGCNACVLEWLKQPAEIPE